MAYLQLASFELCNQEFAVDINIVNGILKSKSYNISKIPNAARELEGFINLRGKVTPIFNLKKKFQYEDVTIKEGSKILVIDSDKSVIGFIVDEVTDIFKINEEDIEPFPRSLGDESCKYISGIGKIEDKMIPILDLIELLSKNDVNQLQSIKNITF